MQSIYETRSEPENTVLEHPAPEYGVFVVTDEGIGLKLENHPFPFHGNATVEAIQAINVVKKILTLQPLKAAEMAVAPYKLKSEYMHPMPRELKRLFTGRIGQLLAEVLEYDSAYRFRLLDLLSETNKDTLSQKPIREILRLIRINKVRDYADAHQKVKKAAYLLIFGLLWPPFHRAFRQSIERSDFHSLQPSEADNYWLKRRTDYHVQPPTR